LPGSPGITNKISNGIYFACCVLKRILRLQKTHGGNGLWKL